MQTCASEHDALVLTDVTVRYGSVPAVEGISGTLRAGASMALLGPNGSGKSTLIKAMLGLVPLSNGTIRVLGRPPVEARELAAYVPQADTLDPEFPISALQVVLIGRYRHVGWLRRPGKRDREIARAALAEVGLADRAAERFGTLSGGQRQRVLLARAIAQQPRLFLLDEPLNGVDVTTQDVLLRALSLRRKEGAAVVMSTHDLDVARHTSDQVCLLNRRLVAFGPTSRVLTPDLLWAAYGGQPLVTERERVLVGH